MTDDEIILAMAICDLLGNPKKQAEIENAIGKAYEKFHSPQRTPQPAKLTRAHIKIDRTE